MIPYPRSKTKMPRTIAGTRHLKRVVKVVDLTTAGSNQIKGDLEAILNY